MMKHMAPLISIAIPVWTGWRYVGDAVRSVLAQPLDDLELVVSVDATDGSSLEVLREFDDPRLRILHPPGSLGMARHYEWCLNHLQGEWVTIMGQDDGLMFDFSQKVTELFRRYPDASAFSFRRAYFFWPGCESVYGDRGLIVRASPTERLVDGNQAILRAMKGLLEHHEFPQIYTNGLVKREIVEEIKQKSEYRFYHDMTPDVYSGFVIAKHLESYVSVDYPAFWTGTSPASTGLALALDGKRLSNSKAESIRDQHLESARQDGLGTSSIVGQELWLRGASSAIFAVNALQMCPFTEHELPSTAHYEEAFAALTAQLILSLLPIFPSRRQRVETWLVMKRRAKANNFSLYRISSRVPMLALKQLASRFCSALHDRDPSSTSSASVRQGVIRSIDDANEWLRSQSHPSRKTAIR